MIQAYNDWHIDEWDGAYPGRFIPLAIIPTWDPALAVAEIRRVAAKGCRAITMPELPHLEGLPSYHDMDHWGPVFEALCDTGLVMCCHIGQGFGAIKSPPDAPIDNLIILACQVSAIAAQDLLWGPAMRTYPDLKIAFSEGGIGWIPFYLDRCDRHYTNQRWLRRDFGGRLPSEVFREHSLACYVTDPTSLKLRHDIGIDIIAWECDYPHSDSIWPDAPEFVHAELVAAGADDEDIDKITWQNACRFFDWDPFATVPARQGDGRGAAGAGHRRRRLDPLPQGVGRALRRTPCRRQPMTIIRERASDPGEAPTMAWDFETEPEFQEKLDWIDDVRPRGGRAARHPLPRPRVHPAERRAAHDRRPAQAAGARRRACGPATSAPSSAARATAS